MESGCFAISSKNQSLKRAQTILYIYFFSIALHFIYFTLRKTETIPHHFLGDSDSPARAPSRHVLYNLLRHRQLFISRATDGRSAVRLFSICGERKKVERKTIPFHFFHLRGDRLLRIYYLALRPRYRYARRRGASSCA